jgi:hypothetical protein
LEERILAGQNRDIHRIGGGAVENLRLKPKEATLEKPGISVLKAASPQEVCSRYVLHFHGPSDCMMPQGS